MMSVVKLFRSTSVPRCKMEFPVPDRSLPSPGASVAIAAFICGGLLRGAAVVSEGRLPRCRIHEKRSYLLFSSLEQHLSPKNCIPAFSPGLGCEEGRRAFCLCCLSFHGEMKENVSGNKDKRRAQGFLHPTTSCAVGWCARPWALRRTGDGGTWGGGRNAAMGQGVCCPGPAPKRLVWGCWALHSSERGGAACAVRATGLDACLLLRRRVSDTQWSAPGAWQPGRWL